MHDKQINGIIYVATNLINSKQYVGQTTRTLNDRISKHKNSTHCLAIHNAIEKHGIENFNWQVIDKANTIDDLNKKEVFWIEKLNTIAPNGYNLRTGGDSYFHTEKTRKKISNANKGKPKSDEHKEKLRLANLGKHPSKESNRKHSRLITFNGVTLTMGEWADKYNLKKKTLNKRLTEGWSIEKALTTKQSEIDLNTKFFTFDNKTLTLLEWSKLFNINKVTLRSRLRYGWSIEKALTTEVGFNPNKKFITFNNKTLTLLQWSKLIGIDRNIIYTRLRSGWSIEKALTTKFGFNQRHRLITFNDKTLTLTQWSKIYNINKYTLSDRLSRGWPLEKAFTTPAKCKKRKKSR